MNALSRVFQSRWIHLGLAALGLLVGYWLTAALSSGEGHAGERGAGEGTAVETDGEHQVYTCSMHPQVRSPGPGKCPICGMDLIPVPTGEGDGHDDDAGAIRLRVTPRALALMQVEVIPAQRRSAEVPVRLSGTLDHDETRLRSISAWVPGRLDRLYVDYTGTRVQRGQPMVEIYSPKLIVAQEELLQASRAVSELQRDGVGVVRETTELTVEAARDRLRLLGMDEAQIARLEAQGRVADQVTIPAPVSGVVIERLASVGDYVEVGQPIYRLADLSRLWSQLEVYESDLNRLSVGQQAELRTEAFPGQIFTGTVSFIDPTIDPRKRTARVRVEVPNPEGRLKPGMLVRGTVTGSTVPGPGVHAQAIRDGADGQAGNAGRESAAPVMIPASAPLITGRRAVVYVQRPDIEPPTFEPREVLLGPRAGDWYVVQEGLAEGELVVARGAFKIDAELQIRGRPSMMQPEGGAPPAHQHGGQGAVLLVQAGVEEVMQASHAFREALGRVVNRQLALVESLAADDPAAARRAAAEVDGALHGLHGALPAGRTRARAERLANAMHEALAGLSAADGLDAQRLHFEDFSAALIEAVDAFGVAGVDEVHRAMCPMVHGREGYWLQAGRDITNPYFGAAMFSCGDILESITAPPAHEGHGS
jgi:membrane fusion protein, copper/silver efflux system